MVGRGRRSLGQTAGLVLLGAIAACRGTPSTEPRPASSEKVAQSPLAPAKPALAPDVPDVPPAPPLAPLAAPSGFVVLKVAGFGDAVVSLPVDTTAPRRIVIALHGNFDRPEWQCEVWRRITAAQDFVLCPRGIPRRDVPKEYDRWEWGSLAKTKAELVAALGALRERYSAYLQSGPIVFTGFSLGAILGARLIQDPELNVGAAVFTEGGFEGWTLARAKSTAQTVRYLLYGCGQTACRNAYRYQLEPLFKKAGLPASMVSDVKAGHTYDDPVAALVQTEWPKVLSSLADQVALPPHKP